MPWHLSDKHPACAGWAVVKDSDNSVAGCHDTKAKAQKQLAALYASEGGSSMGREYASFGMELSQAKTQGRTLTGYASVFNYPIETLESWLYGTTTYMRPGAFGNTLQEHRDEIQALYNHGHDPQIGEKPLGKPSVMREDAHGLYVEVPLDRTSYNDDIIASLESGALRAMSIGFVPERDSYNDDRSVREIHQVRLYDFGPVTFPANRASTVALHSLSVDLERHWDGAAAMRSCSSAAEFRKIAFERNNDSDPDTAAHWALPHHPNPDGAPGNADPAGVSAALAALHGGRGTPSSGAPDLKLSVASVEAHLTAHQGSEESSMGAGRHGEEPIRPKAPDDAGLLARADVIRYARELEAEARRMEWVRRTN